MTVQQFVCVVVCSIVLGLDVLRIINIIRAFLVRAVNWNAKTRLFSIVETILNIHILFIHYLLLLRKYTFHNLKCS